VLKSNLHSKSAYIFFINKLALRVFLVGCKAVLLMSRISVWYQKLRKKVSESYKRSTTKSNITSIPVLKGATSHLPASAPASSPSASAPAVNNIRKDHKFPPLSSISRHDTNIVPITNNLKRRHSQCHIDDVDYRDKKIRPFPKKTKRDISSRKYNQEARPLTPADIEMLEPGPEINRQEHSSYFSYADALRLKELCKLRIKNPAAKHKISKVRAKVSSRR
jgi:hypothetical protein